MGGDFYNLGPAGLLEMLRHLDFRWAYRGLKAFQQTSLSFKILGHTDCRDCRTYSHTTTISHSRAAYSLHFHEFHGFYGSRTRDTMQCMLHLGYFKGSSVNLEFLAGSKV